MLFEEYQYFNYQFPEPQYLGSKQKERNFKLLYPQVITHL